MSWEIIISKGMGDYLLIVWDFIAWAKSRWAFRWAQGEVLEPDRSFSISFRSPILNRLGFSLFFERFINPERLSYPDIDVDICMDRRGEVIDYTIRKYGKDKVARLSLLAR